MASGDSAPPPNERWKSLYREVNIGERGLPPRRKIGPLTLAPISKKNYNEGILQFYTADGREIVSPQAGPGLSPGAYLSKLPMHLNEDDELAVELDESLLSVGLPLGRNIKEEISALGSKYKDRSSTLNLTDIAQFNSMRVLFKILTQHVIDFYNKTVSEAGASPEYFEYYEKNKTPLHEIFTKKNSEALQSKINKFFKEAEVARTFNALRPYLENVRLFRERGIRSTQELVNPFLLYDIFHEIEKDYATLVNLGKLDRSSSAALLAAVNAEVERAASAHAESRAATPATPGFLPRAPSRATVSGPASRVGSSARNAEHSPVPTAFFRNVRNAVAAIDARARAAGGEGPVLAAGEGEGDLSPGLSPLAGNGSPFSPFVASPLGANLVPLQRLNYEHGGGRRKQTRHTRRNKTAKPFWPPKYFRGLSKRAKTQRKREIQRYGAMNWKNPAAYVGFQTNRGVRTRPSSYTDQWNALFPTAKSLKERAEATGVPLKEIEESYNRGMAAWRTGHRPGATQQQWGYARVSSFLLCGKTHFTTDSDLVRRAKQRSAAARSWWKKQCHTD